MLRSNGASFIAPHPLRGCSDTRRIDSLSIDVEKYVRSDREVARVNTRKIAHKLDHLSSPSWSVVERERSAGNARVPAGIRDYVALNRLERHKDDAAFLQRDSLSGDDASVRVPTRRLRNVTYSARARERERKREKAPTHRPSMSRCVSLRRNRVLISRHRYSRRYAFSSFLLWNDQVVAVSRIIIRLPALT